MCASGVLTMGRTGGIFSKISSFRPRASLVFIAGSEFGQRIGGILIRHVRSFSAVYECECEGGMPGDGRLPQESRGIESCWCFFGLQIVVGWEGERFKYVLRELCMARQAVYLPAYRASCLAQSSRLHCDLIPLVE